MDAEYDRGLRHADDLVAGFLDALRARGLDANTVLLVTADHGIEFGEHGGIGHARGVYEEQVRVPLIVVDPRVPRARRVRGQVGLIDLAPTLLGLAGLPAPGHFVGTSLLPFLADGTEPPERTLVAEQLLGPRQTLVRTSRRAWIQKPSGLELYDLAADPREQKDLAPEMTSLAEEGAQRIADFRADCRRRQTSLRGGPGHVPLDPELTKSLRALGYIK